MIETNKDGSFLEREVRMQGKANHVPLLVSAREAAAVCGKSLRTWRNWDSAGRIPRPVKIGRSTMWRIDELQKWIDLGCPGRDAWEARAH
jgi:predicted DNA-binding transcriptional regulator AlpA